MGGCIAGLAGSFACCVTAEACHLCCSCFKRSTSTRVGYSIMLFVGIIFALLALIPKMREWLNNIPWLCKSVGVTVEGIGVTISDAQYNCEQVVGYSTVYRIFFALVCFFVVMTLFTIRVQNSRGFRAKFHNGFWGIKLLLVLAFLVGAFFIHVGAFNTAFMIVGLIGGFLFILVQLILLVDFAHTWNKSWVQRMEEDEGTRCYCFGLVFSMAVFYATAVILTVLMYIFYGNGCVLHYVIISVNLLVCIVLSVVSILPKVQESLKYSGLLQSSLMTLYVMFITYSALTNNPDRECNPTLNTIWMRLTGGGGQAANVTGTTVAPVSTTAGGISGTILGISWSMAIGLAWLVCSVIYSAIRNSTMEKVDRLMGREQTTLESGHESTGDSNDDEEEGCVYNYSIFHVMLALSCLYAMMTLTNWYSPSSDFTVLNANPASLWVKAASSWVALLIYGWTLVAPLILTDREFE